MIVYFSATGNSKYVAERIAKALGTNCVSIQNISDDELRDVDGLVTPTYALGIPSIVEDFLLNHKIGKGERPLFCVSTYGTTPGQGFYWADRALNIRSGISFEAFYGVKMPDTWTPIFDLSDSKKVAAKNKKVEPQLDEIIGKIKENSVGNYLKNKIPATARFVYRPYYASMRKTKDFTVNDNCIGCGLCAKKCPDKAIEIRNNKPVWIKAECIKCLGCLHRCPKFAIQHGKKTAKHGQYLNPNVTID